MHWPEPPREITKLVRRRLWLEPRVRAWILIAILMFVVAIGLFVRGLQVQAQEQWLIDHGIKVRAIITAANGETVAYKREPPSSPVYVEFPWKGERYETRSARLLDGRKDQNLIQVKSILPIRVNPDDPEEWTWRDEPMPLLSRIIGSFIALPISLLALLIAYLRYLGLARLWNKGQAIDALIVDTRFIASAPRCRLAHVTPSDESDTRIYTVYLPPSLGDLHRGDSVGIIRSRSQSRKAIGIAWFL